MLGVPKTRITASDGVAVAPLAEMIGIHAVAEVFTRGDLPFDRHQEFSAIAAGAADARVVIAGGTEGEEVIIDTTAEDAAADLLIAIVKRGCRLTLIESITAQKFFGRTFVLIAEEGAHVFVATISGNKPASDTGDKPLLMGQGLPPVSQPFFQSVSFANRIVVAPARAEVTWVEVAGGSGGFRKSDMTAFLEGDGASFHHYLFVNGSGEERLDHFALALHRADGTRSRIHALGFADDASRTIYRGDIDIPKGLCGVDAAQDGRFVLLSKEAKIDAIPGLDIASREVAAAHKLAVSPFGERELFYARLRGIDDRSARALMRNALTTSLLSCVKNERVVESVRSCVSPENEDYCYDR